MIARGLSHAQERMWFLERLRPGTAVHNVSSALRLQGPLQPAALQGALRALAARHDALRSCFEPHDGGARRLIADAPRLDLERIALPPSPRGDREVPMAALERHARRPFDLARAPLARAALARISAEDHVLLLVLHHLICDGWSLGVLHAELAALYNAALAGERCALAPLDSDYDAYVRWERAPATRARRAVALAFWREQLDGLEMLRLPSDRARPATQTPAAARRIGYLPLSALERLERLARATASSLFMVLQMAFAVVLSRYADQRDIAVGAPLANREPGVGEGVLGLFVNTIVLRCQIDGTRSFVELIGDHRRSFLRALEHGHAPFDAVVEELRPERGLSHNPLFQVLLALQGPEARPPELSGLRVSLLDLDLGVTRFDLECTTWREPRRLKVRLAYASSCFDDATGERLLGSYLRLLERVAEEPASPMERLSLLSERERRELLGRRRSLGHRDLDSDLARLLEAQAERSPAAPALQTSRGCWSYAELLNAARRLAAVLRAHGVAPENVVAVCAPRGFELAASALGVLLSGGALLALDLEEPAARSAYLLADSRAAIGLWAGAERPRPARGIRWIAIEEALRASAAVGHGAAPGSNSRLAYVIYTSGTSGRPKGVLVEHRNVVNTLVGCRAWFGFRAEDRFLCLAPPTFDIFYFELLSPLLCGGCARLVERAELLDPARLAGLVRRASVMQAVPGLMTQILAALQEHPGSTPLLRHAITGGDKVPARLPGAIARAFPRARVSVLYGPTEATIVCAGIALRRPRSVRGHPIGRPLPNVLLRVYDEQRQPVPIGSAGELYIGGAGVARGYLSAASSEAERFTAVEGERLYRSGDRVRWLPDGSLEFLGRRDDQIKLHGVRIEPAEIEAALESLPEVREAAVLAHGERDARHLRAYVVPTRPAHARRAARQRHLADWRALFDQTHRAARGADCEHDFTGWRSSYTGAPLARAELEEWRRGTLLELTTRLPAARTGRLRMLEIGCGTGLLLFALAPLCERYVATDFARVVLERVRREVRARAWAHVELHLREAGDLADLRGGGFDVAILNSVAQYLPGLEDLGTILGRALRCLRPDGLLFVGDVRNLALHEPFLAGVELSAKPGLAGEPLRERVRERARAERELLVHPAYFARLAADAGVGDVEVLPRRGYAHNELRRYRYNAVLRAGGADGPAPRDLPWLDWRREALTLPDVLRRLHDERPEQLALAGVPDASLSADLDAWGGAGATGAARGGDPSCPEALRAQAAGLGYETALSCARGCADGRFDAVIHRGRDRAEGAPRWAWPRASVPRRLATDPLAPLLRSATIEDTRTAIAQRLPRYAMPAAFTVLDALPRTANGKLDRTALARLATIQGEHSDLQQAADPPVGPTECALARAWQAVLGGAALSRNTNFFAAGGTSLLAIRVAVHLRARGVALDAQDLFAHQTIATLAAALQARGAEARRSTPAPARPGADAGARTPDRGAPRRGAQPARSRAGQGTLMASGRILLTGATGFLGIHLLRALLDRTQAEIACLVRGADGSRAEARLREQWRWYFPGVAARGARVRVLAGDVALPGLGLQHDARRLSQRCAHVIHSAGDVRHVGERAEIFRVNLDGTRNVLALVAESRGAALHHISTIGIKGVHTDARERRLTERDLDIGQSPTEDYSASKLAAERVVRDFLRAGGEGSVLRVGTIAPHSRSARFQRNAADHFFVRYLRSTIELGLGCDWPGRTFALTPVDTLAVAVLRLSAVSARGRETYHLSTPHTVSHGRLIEVLQALGYPIRVLAPEQFAAVALRLAREERYEHAVGGVLGLIDPPGGRHVRLDSSWTEARLRELGFRYPRPSTNWLGRAVERCVERGVLPAPVHGRAVAG